MFGQSKKLADPRPRSAVSHGVGLAGLVGLAVWIWIARTYGMDGPVAALTGCVACALPMIGWSLLRDRVHLRSSTGMQWHDPSPFHKSFDISCVKLAGLWATWALIAGAYCLGRWYWTGNYLFAMEILQAAVPALLLISIPYVLILDRYTVEPRDGAWHFGKLITGARGQFRMTEVYHHLRAWAVKGFFLAFMLSIVPGGFTDLIAADFTDVLQNPIALAHWLIVAMFVVDVQFATVGYILTLKPLDSHIRTANPHLAGWVAALICYPPFLLMDTGGPLDYHVNTSVWGFWLEGRGPLQWVWAGLLVGLTGIYAWATVAFGLRFSNLTHRGILTHGPYALSKHPAYLAKNVYWWLATMPFLATSGSIGDMARNTALMALVSGVYFWRAKTEEKHLLTDPDYKAYAEWMDRHGPVPGLINWVKRRVGWWQPA